MNPSIDKKIRVKMLCNWCNSFQLCKEWNHMTKGNYIWNNIEITWTDIDIDYYVIINKPMNGDFFIPEKTLLFQMEPWCYSNKQNWGVKSWGEWAKPDPKKFLHVHSHDKYLNVAMWQLSATYEQLKTAKIIKNNNNIISSIVSPKYFDPGHIKRVDFLKYIEQKNDPLVQIYIYGKDNVHKFKNYKGQIPDDNKDLGITPYKYYFMCENNSEKNYITEKLWEPILTESLCFYWGCPNANEYIDSKAFINLDLDSSEDFEKSFQIIRNSILNNLWEERLSIIQKEKKKILEEYSFFPMLEKIIQENIKENIKENIQENKLFKKIGFLPIQISERGTTTAVYDYAYHNEKILGNKSIIFYQKGHPENFPEYENKFNKEFKCYAYYNFSEIDEIVKREKIDAMYIIKYGLDDGVSVKNCPNLIHSVFVSQPHGEKYAFVSRYLSEKNGGDIPFVPHMIDLPREIKTDLRKELKIPKNAIVFGGFGGKTSFDIPFVHKCIDKYVEENSNVYFLFMNFEKNTKEHKRIIYLPPSINKENKVKFINTCDVMIHARSIGETFGLAIGEFSYCNKPIITYFDKNRNLPVDREHIRILDDRGIYYSNEEELLSIFRNFKIEDKDWNCYNDYNPENVMRIFQKVFLDKINDEIKYEVVKINGRKYKFYRGYDSTDYDVTFVGKIQLDEIEKIANNNNCSIFNNLGFIKNKFNNLSKSQWITNNDGVFIKIKEDIVEEKDVFLITSVINVSNEPLNYHKVRSVYNTEERFIQTLNSIISIKLRMPKSKIYLIECSKISEKYSNILQSLADGFFNISEEVSQIINGPDKSLSETIIMQIGIKKILEQFVPERIFKLSGRYYLNDNFNINNFSKETFNFKKEEHYVHTVLYSIPGKNIKNFLEILENTEKNIKNSEKYIDIEHALFNFLPKTDVKFLSQIGVSGNIAPTGELRNY